MLHRNTRDVLNPSQSNTQIAGFGAIEDCRASFARGCQLARILLSCDRRIHRLALVWPLTKISSYPTDSFSNSDWRLVLDVRSPCRLLVRTTNELTRLTNAFSKNFSHLKAAPQRCRVGWGK